VDRPRIQERVAADLGFQSYLPAAGIEGAWRAPLRRHHALNGSFMELMRLDGGTLQQLPQGFTLAQLSLSRAEPGRLNAFHIHPRRHQNEIWSVVAGELLVWLVDCREDSPSAGERQPVLLSGESPEWLHIPSGVAHGYRAGGAGALLLYGMDQQFDREDPNEGRLPWDYFGSALWDEDRG
jgi:dTDP-4-dehydrorhamnose 3,5-epimerase